MKDFHSEIFNISSDEGFEKIALQIFHIHTKKNNHYKKFLELLKVNPDKIRSFNEIPFLPVDSFKIEEINIESRVEAIFESSGTTDQTQSKHFVADINLYIECFTNTFRNFYGDFENYIIFALLPSYLERKNSSLVFMCDNFIRFTKHNLSGFYLYNFEKLLSNLELAKKEKRKILLLGVSFALLDFAEQYQIDLSGNIVMETGGMKGRRNELTREELHRILKKSFNVTEIHSEYGMTELLSQAYSKEKGKFQSPPWMKILIRDINDPLKILSDGERGAVNVIDLANIYSCPFIATQDLGIVNSDGTFEITGRTDTSELRGCNLMIADEVYKT